MSPALDSRSRTLRRLAVVAVVTFQAFLALSSQYLFAHIDPQPLRSSRQRWIFNTLILLLMTCFTRSSLSHAGCPQQLPAAILRSEETTPEKPLPRRCRKCNAPKPLRWHHCKACQTCIPKMDHHCFWINNCVSHITFPHFTRFLLYSVAAMSYLQYFLFRCFKVLWDNRHLPHVRCILCSLSYPLASDPLQYLGPTAPQLVHLFALGFSNSIALLALSILLSKAVYSLFTNVYMIEGWEIERHEALVERARKSSGYLYGPGGVEIRIQKQEYPYDIGFWGNMVQGMGTANPLAWFWPFSRSPTIESAIEWPVNEFEGRCNDDN